MTRLISLDSIAPMPDESLLIIVCGASAAISVPSYLEWLGQEIDLSLRVLLTASAERFLHRQVTAWIADEVYSSDDPALKPIALARQSLGIVVLPATANILASAALGLAATPAQTALLASDRPVLFFPSMNASMLEKNSTQRHIVTLRAEGHTVVEPQQAMSYDLSRREVTVGPAMQPPDQAVETIIKWLEDRLNSE
jgi:phosphopantothenoylcysteine synthetase/decarboxylase